MNQIGILIDAAEKILNISITACGYTFTLMQWLLFGIIGTLVLGFIYRFLR